MMSKNQSPFDFANLTPEDLINMTDKAIIQTQRAVDKVIAVDGQRTVENTLHRLDRGTSFIENAYGIVDLMHNVHPDANIRDAAQKCIPQLIKFDTELWLNKELYKAIAELNVSSADPVTQRVHEHMLRDFRRNGVNKDGAARKRIQELQEQGAEVSTTFGRNINEGTRSIEVPIEELEDLPDSYKKEHKPNASGKVTITTNYPDYIPFMRYAKNEEMRKRLYYEFQNRAPENEKALKDLLRIRHELAALLGYSHYADYITETRMIGSAKNAAAFINKIEKLTREHAQHDYKLFLEQKRKDNKNVDEIAPWDRFYYKEQLKRSRYNLDSRDLMPYFEYDRVKQGIFDLTSKLFGISFKQISDAPVWHESVECYELYEGDKLLGRFYLDMHPRKGKFSHGACFHLVPGVDGYQFPEDVLVCNFPGGNKNTNEPALMEYDEVKTFLHEFGHLLHALFAGHTPWLYFSGTRVQRDFAEAPSQMLEKLLERIETLQTFARHYKTDKPIPTEFITKLSQTNTIGRGLYVRRQAMIAALSLEAYVRDPADLNMETLWKELYNIYSSSHYPEGTHFWWSFGHLTEYSAAYYTYPWSKAIAEDLFSAFDPDNPYKPEIALRYRKKVLEPGGTKDAKDLVKDFLGRDFNFDAFEKWLNS
ncbi:Zn-dependent oligopeptidase [Patescibacteria group bacterium AH-259-L07]|nr:Zn-dependent oligopeptidase [Patescibacteria group bacterium AH-259-L07]